MTLFFHLVWMLCALGAVVFAAASARDRRRAVGFGGGLIAGFVMARPGPPDPALVGSLAVGAVAIFLFRPRYADLAAMLGGSVAGLFTAVLQAQGFPFLSTPFVVVTLSGVSAWLARSRSTFAPECLPEGEFNFRWAGMSGPGRGPSLPSPPPARAFRTTGWSAFGWVTAWR